MCSDRHVEAGDTHKATFELCTLFSYTGVDVLKDDGFYSAVLLKFPQNGCNPVKVRTAAKGERRKAKNSITGQNRGSIAKVHRLLTTSCSIKENCC